MSSVYKDRYGIPGAEITQMVRRFYRYLMDSDWEKVDDYLKWCSENGYQKGLRLYKRDKSKPHGPENSYFPIPGMTVRAKKADIRRRKEERKTLVSPFCVGCEEKCRNTAVGCERYRAWFVKNWNQNISIAKPVPVIEDPNTIRHFRYEHPDLVREGIVFEHSQSIP